MELHKRYGQREILSGVSVAIDHGERVGLVGMNGSGKSTLARILAGLDEPDAGQVVGVRGARVAYLAQEPHMEGEKRAVEVVLSGLEEWSRAMARHEELSRAVVEAGEAGSATESLLAQQAEVGAQVERLGGWDVSHQARSMLGHLGITDPDRRVGTMSGGERRRVALARILVAKPDLAILDEPTNHLDIDSIEWLERYLGDGFAGAMLLVTHDRYLLDRVVNRTLELDRAALYSYDGGWESYLMAKAERLAHAERAEANRQNFLRRELDWLRRQPKARTTKQKARIQRAHEAIDAAPGATASSASIRIQGARSGGIVLDLEDVAVDVAGRRLIDGLRLSLGKGERVGVIGPNGCGKTSLMRVLLGELAPAKGAVNIGKNTRVAYLDQQRSGLNPDLTVYDSVAKDHSDVIHLGDQELTVYSYLERFLFPVPAQRQKVGSLSGGERARVALARILCDAANLVILDEPTNDLDVTTLAALEEALLSFGGTVLCVTHDRFFLDRVATAILAFMGEGRVVLVHGNYQSYLAYCEKEKAEREAEERAQKPAAKPGRESQGQTDTRRGTRPQPERRGLTYGEEIELTGMMDRIAAAESEVARLESELASPTFFELDHTAQAAFAKTLEAARASAEALVERWAELESRKDGGSA